MNYLKNQQENKDERKKRTLARKYTRILSNTNTILER